MQCFVYKSSRKADTYLYLDRRDDFSSVPAALCELLGPLTLVLELELHGERRLARENPAEVLRNLSERGYHLQLPEPREPHRFAN